MKALIQRVTQASVKVEDLSIAQINNGMLVLLGVEANDTEVTVQRLASKVLKYRIFSDENDKMNLNIQQSKGEILVVSQFTLVADTQKGNRPGFSKGASPQWGEHLYHAFIEYLDKHYQACKTGQFGANMAVSLVNDGPVTFMLEAH